MSSFSVRSDSAKSLRTAPQAAIELLFAFSRQTVFAYRALFSWLHPSTYVLLKLLGPITQVIFFVLIGIYAGKEPEYFAIGNAVRLFAVSGVFGVVIVVTGERVYGTLGPIVATPTPSFVKYFGRGAMQIIDGFTSVAAGFAIAGLLFGLDFSRVLWGWFVLALVITSFATAGFGYTGAALSLLGPSAHIVSNVAFSVMLLVCGVNYPISRLPGSLQIVGLSLPVTHGLEAIRMIFHGQSAGVGILLWEEFAVGAAWLVLGYVLFEYAEYRARVTGTLDLY